MYLELGLLLLFETSFQINSGLISFGLFLMIGSFFVYLTLTMLARIKDLGLEFKLIGEKWV